MSASVDSLLTDSSRSYRSYDLDLDMRLAEETTVLVESYTVRPCLVPLHRRRLPTLPLWRLSFLPRLPALSADPDPHDHLPLNSCQTDG